MIISIISGVWLLPKRDSYEAQWNLIKDTLTDPDKIILSLGYDFNKSITRQVIKGFLKEEQSKEPKDEERIEKLKKDLPVADGKQGIAFLNNMASGWEKINPTHAKVTHDIKNELTEWGQIVTESRKKFYLPNMSRELRKTLVRMNCMEKVMKGFFYAGIIIITLFSAINFLGIDILGLILRLV